MAWTATVLGKDVEVWHFSGGMAAWQKQGGELVATPEYPSDFDRIDFLYVTHDRHQGNKAAAQQYLSWEQGLWARLKPSEREIFIVDGAYGMNSVPIDQPLSGSQDFFSGICWLLVHVIKVERSFHMANSYLKKKFKKKEMQSVRVNKLVPIYEQNVI